MSEVYELKKFNLKSMTKFNEPYHTIGIIGGRGTGKTTIIRNILYYFHPLIRYTIIFSGTAHFENEYKGMIPELYMHEKLDDKIIDQIFIDQSRLINKINEGKVHKGCKKLVIIILDDIVGTNKEWKNSINLEKILKQGRHFNILLILSVQTPLNIPSGLRDNFNYVISTSINTDKRKTTLYENFSNVDMSKAQFLKAY